MTQHTHDYNTPRLMPQHQEFSLSKAV